MALLHALRRYIETAGGRLDIAAQSPDDEAVDINIAPEPTSLTTAYPWHSLNADARSVYEFVSN